MPAPAGSRSSAPVAPERRRSAQDLEDRRGLVPAAPEQDLHELGGDRDQTEHRRDDDQRNHPDGAQPDPRNAPAVADPRERREEHLRRPGSRSGSRRSAAGVRERVGAERAAPRKRPIRKLSRFGRPSDGTGTEDVAGVAGHAAEAVAREPRLRAPGRAEPEQERRDGADREVLGDDRPRAGAEIASAMPMAQLIVVAMMVRISRDRKRRSRVSSAPWTMPSAVNRNARDSTANSGCTCGSP